MELADRLDEAFDRAVEAILACRGRVVTTGIGKSGAIAGKIASTLASTGTPALFLHSAEAHHGDLGMITASDVVLALSHSGRTREILELVPYVKSIGVPLIVITGDADSPLAQLSDIVLNCWVEREADAHDLAPTTSAIAALALGDALAIELMEKRRFTPEQFARFHPGGSLGMKLAQVRDIMRTGDANPVVLADAKVLDVVFVMTAARSAGVASVVDETGRLVGLFTDGDLRRRLPSDPLILERTVQEVMNPHPTTISEDRLASEAFRILHENKWDNLPVIDAEGRPVGLVDVQDLLDAHIL